MSSPHNPPGDVARDGEQRFRALFEHARHFMAVLAVDGTVLEANRALLALGATVRDAVVGRPFVEGPWWPAGGEAVAQLRTAVAEAAAGQAVGIEVEALAGERPAILALSITPLHDEAGGVAQLIVEAADVSEAKWAERALRISEAKFAGIVSIASDAIISIDESQSILHFNTGAEAIFGWSAEEMLGQPLDLLIPERFRAVHREHVRGFGRSPVTARRMGERAEILGLRRDGSEFPADASISRLDVGGQRIFTVVLRDITDRKRTEQGQALLAEAGALLASSLDYEATLRSVVWLVVPKLADWAVLHIRGEPGEPGELVRLEAAHEEATIRERLEAMNAQPPAATPRHPVFAALRSGEPVLIERVDDDLLAAMTRDAQQRATYEQLGLRSLMYVPLRARGATIGVIGCFSATRSFDAQDLLLARELAARAALSIDNARLYREAQAAIRARDDVLAVVSHDLGNPLSAIRIGTKLVRRQLAAFEVGEPAKQLEGIEQAAAQMERLVTDLLDVKRLEAGHLTLMRRLQRPSSLLAEVVDMIGNLGEERGQTVVCEPAEPLPAVQADRPRTLQVLQNLLGNAIKFTPTGGRITLRAEAADGMVRFSVVDTGPGIPPEELPFIFDRFWQAKREGRLGIGLGLAIAKGIVEAHGGRIWAESRPGEGTAVYFTLPAEPSGGAPT
jgi:PAS domain S-box-containing protein